MCNRSRRYKGRTTPAARPVAFRTFGEIRSLHTKWVLPVFDDPNSKPNELVYDTLELAMEGFRVIRRGTPFDTPDAWYVVSHAIELPFLTPEVVRLCRNPLAVFAFLDGDLADIAPMYSVGSQSASFLLAVAQSVLHVCSGAEYNPMMFTRHIRCNSSALAR